MTKSEIFSVNQTSLGELIQIMGLRVLRSNEGLVMIEHGPTNLWATIEGLITQDIANGRASAIAEVRISHLWAAFLYCEGKLTEDDLRHATQDDGLFLDKIILGLPLKIRILKDGDKRLNGYHSGTYDAEGNIV